MFLNYLSTRRKLPNFKDVGNILGFLDIEIPLEGVANELILQDTMDLDISDATLPDGVRTSSMVAAAVGFIERWLNRNSRITPIFGPHANYTLDAGQLAATRAAE